jgi:ABC-type lipoprotein release transport system permease subunit
VLLAFASSRGVENWLRTRLPFAPTDLLIHWQWWIAGACVAGALAVGGLAGLLPAWRASQRSPMEAIREGGRV